MRTPGEWPRWPLLPLTRRSGGTFCDPQYCAFLFSDDRPVIYFAVIYMLPKSDATKTWDEVLGTIDKKEYPSFEALADEYKVD
jgi:hypothetical protein